MTSAGIPEIARLLRCLSPKSIVMVGGREVERALFQCHKMGYAGTIWLVNPHRPALGGLPCLPDIDALPDVPDAAFVAIPAEPTIPAVRQLSLIGTGGAVCYASGFREAGEAGRHDRLLAAADGMPMIGPNCYGFINAVDGAVLWPDQHGMRRCRAGVAIFSASGNISINITMQKRGLPLALMVSIGNQAMIGVEELVQAVLADERIQAVGLLIEGLKDLPKFVEVARQAAEEGKPVVVLKNGHSATGASIALSHTATLAGESSLYDALFRRLGVSQCEDLETFLETLKLLAVCGPLKGDRIASMSCSGGEASMVADLAERYNLTFPALLQDHRQQVAATLNPYVCVDNPLDYHTFIWGDPVAMQATFTAMMRGGFDMTMLLLDYPSTNDCDNTEWVEAGQAFARAVKTTGYPGTVVISMAENVTEMIMEELAGHGIPVLLGIPQALGAIQAAAQVGRWEYPLPQLSSGASVATGRVPPKSAERVMVNEWQAKRMLREYGIGTPRNQVVESLESAIGVSESIGFPIVLKMAQAGVAHKSEQKGVRVGLQDAQEVRKAATDLFLVSDQVLVEEMVGNGVLELHLGVVKDAQFGHYFVLSAGGTWVEMLNDRAILLPPLSDPMVREALNSLRLSPLLKGYRNGMPADIEAVVQAVMALASFLDAYIDELAEVEINPLIVKPQGDGAVAADALIVFDRTVVNPQFPPGL